MSREREIPVRIVVRRKGHGTAHHGGAWKVAMADFMTAMFALFLVLWLVNQSSDVKSAIAGYFQDPLGRADEFGSSILPGEGAQAATVRPLSQTDIFELRSNRLQALAEKIESEMRQAPEMSKLQGFVEMTMNREGLQIQLLEDSTGVFFESGSAAPSPTGLRFLDLLGTELGRMPNPVRIEGHTDARPYSQASAYSNWELSADRANTARRLMSARGLRDEQVTEVRAHADRSLRTPDDPFAAANRRISITVLFPGGPVPVDSARVAAMRGVKL